MDSQSARFAGRIVVGALAVVTDPQGRVLFVAQQKGPFAGHWLMPGGGVEAGETAEAAVAREILEETGFALADLRFLRTYEMLGEWAGGSYHILMLAFRATAAGEVPPGFIGDGVGSVRWAHVGELPLHSTDMQMLTDAGLAAFSPDEINLALQADGITMRVY